MQNQNQLFEDLSRLMSSAAGTMAGASRELQARMQEKFRDAVGGLDLVSREEFEAVKAMAAEARAEVAALKAQLQNLQTGATAKPATKPDTKSAATKPAAKPAAAKSAAGAKKRSDA